MKQVTNNRYLLSRVKYKSAGQVIQRVGVGYRHLFHDRNYVSKNFKFLSDVRLNMGNVLKILNLMLPYCL
jgi:hypothetical protein